MRYRDRARDRTLLVAASYVVLRRGDDVLLQLRRGTGYLDEHWATLAGHLEPNETVTEAAAREAREEAGVRIELDDLEPVTTVHRLQVDGPQIEQRCDVFFQTRRWSGEPVPMEPGRCADMRWFPLHDLPEPVVPHERMVLDLLRQGSVPAVLTIASGR